MSAQVKPDTTTALIDEERKLVQALIGRELLTTEEVKNFLDHRPQGEPGVRELLTQLVKANHLTPNQARRAYQNLEAWLHQQIPGYEMLERLGQGSMGRVFKGRQLSVNRLVAIKILHPKLAAEEGYIERFLQEARVVAKLSSNNIVQAIDAGSVGSLHYFVMEYVEGVTIKQELETGKVYPEREALEIALQIAQALEHAHRRQLIHRDVKPANVILAKDGIAKLADLGLARHVSDDQLAEDEKGATIGTPYYIAPEMIGGRMEADIRVDIYSLGATLYHMVTGRPPFPGARVRDVLKGHLSAELTPPDHINTALSAGLGEVVEFMMMKDREQRYRTPAELIFDLECLLRSEPPKLARQGTQFDVLEKLAEGEAEAHPEEQLVATSAPAGMQAFWFWLLAILLVLSVLVNLVLLTP